MPWHNELLSADEPPACLEENSAAHSNFVIVVDHAAARIPRRLGSLGLLEVELTRHIAWDIGALEVARRMARTLDAILLAQNYSRLVIDCNRDPQVASSIPVMSESSEVPGNLNLSTADAALRRREIFDPYHERIRQVLDQRLAAGRKTVLIAQHTMTDLYKTSRREMHAAVLYNRDRRFAGLVLDQLRQEKELIVADNEPYYVSDATDYTIPHHGERRSLPHVEIEIRQDLVSAAAGQAQWAARIARALTAAEELYFKGVAP
jgi:predicted N-formylglutamate amidohydrolase